jgi:leucyl/phenylalanyl-tRNA--protein transferase
MFSRVPDTSKIALVYLVDHLRRKDFCLLDTQFITPHLQRFGAIEISRREYKRRLDKALRVWAKF